jgi:acetyl-CoA acetyltransferase
VYFNDKINLKFMNNKSTDVVIISAVRTPIGTYKGSLKDLRVDQLGTIVISEVLKRGKISSNQIDEVIMGQVLTAGGGQNPARQAAVNAGIPISKPAHLVNQVCGSGLRAVISGYQSIKLSISRQQQDEFALISQRKTEIAIKNNKFDNEIVNIDYNGTFLDRDEHPRKDLKLSDLEKLRTVFKNDGTVTPGNSSGINDGAAALLLTTLKEAEKNSIKPFAKLISWASVGLEPSLMGLGPIEAIRQATKKANWNLDEIDLFEINEAFAAQAIAVISELAIDENKVNVNGGAIALGHPIGASGARILVTLIHEMERQNKKKGCAALCIGGGMGIALCVEKI